MEENYSIVRDQSEGHKALLELEKIFNKKPRSGTFGIHSSQIQALTSFIPLFEQYPYPVIINAAILKLADWFRTFNNTVKYYVYKIFKQASDQHLAKLINVEETVRRILPILGSNDTIARSITLRMLGCMSMIIAEKLDVQYGIIQQLELATDQIELEAAIWAADQICSKSSRFPAVIFSKIVNKLENPNTPFNIKQRLVKIFRHMHQDIRMAREAKLACLVLLKDPNTKLIIVTLRTLTLLLSQVIIDRKEQIDRLLDYAFENQEICYNVLYDLVLLGKNDIMFDETHILRLLQLIITQTDRRIQQRAFQCAQALLENHQKLLKQMIHSTDFINCLTKCEQIMSQAIQEHHPIAITCARFLYVIFKIGISQPTQTEMDIDIPDDVRVLARRVAETIHQVDIQVYPTKLKDLLKIKAKYCLLLDWDCDATFQSTFETITRTQGEMATTLLTFLSTISIKCHTLDDWFPKAALEELNKRIKEPKVYIYLIRLLFRTTKYNSQLCNQLMEFIQIFGQEFQVNGWYLYQIGMEAGRCGWYELMHKIMKELCKKVSSEANYYWLSSLSWLGYAEWRLINDQGSCDDYIKVLTDLKALQSYNQIRTFQYRYIELRMELIEAVDYGLRSLNKVKKMQQCAIRFRKIAFRYDSIFQSYEKENEMYKICALVCEHAAKTLFGSDFCIDPSLILLSDSDPMKEYLDKIIQWEQLDHLEPQDRFKMCNQDMKDILTRIKNEPLLLPNSFFKNQKNTNTIKIE